ncbi:IS1414, transposase [Escherichia coli]|nr:IS1414, transposase [Escherichia coli]SQM26869.1 IS1414, transposase [Escherichia coli]
MDNQILSLYAKGMTTREIAAAFKELYDADVSPALVSKVTDAVMEPRQPGGCKLKTGPVRPVVAARPADYVCSEDPFY